MLLFSTAVGRETPPFGHTDTVLADRTASLWANNHCWISTGRCCVTEKPNTNGEVTTLTDSEF